ncbi:UDP-N-acetylmuramoyl-tripeptide--D-alanyl-D-alanine ligase [uncultured Thiothrix sp.]|uniref:UDP-N-acetylmuramoyl-tripeptide--D-alanyl-D- alanine ligase n=1 Tax=uncultured Thiothrix sp. TaxID=223185 RepID=UPI00261E30F1|nr:UDP-N-acetylmuramoyl-tripeptide--D-alanyl-D-alanine ligase [uncultured Thiothrix sp.]HMT91833.1 UDP-N-acetylmuramoyl-tripeptide--D-alanyl-D-alanine ligase [Thiolinea sp.]
MTWLTLAQIAEFLQADLHAVSFETAQQLPIERVERDSRAVQTGDLFLALKGERFDAHDFVPQVAGKASAALVAHPLDAAIPQLVVPDVRLALGQLAKAWREQFKYPVIGLTGSNGKTTLKEMLTAILSQQGQTLATIGNLNNDIGVPLTLLRLRTADQFAVIEMGANHFGEIDYLTHLALPNVAILNNAGAAHLEGFGDIAGVARAKGEIFAGLAAGGIAVINADDTYAGYWRELNQGRPLLSFGFSQDADLRGELSADNQFIIHKGADSVSVRLKLLGKHNQLNALAAAAGATALGFSLATIKQGLESLQPVKGRLNPKQGRHGVWVIDDTYNANPSSTAAAIAVLAEQQGRKILVLGDMGELGNTGEQLHFELGQLAKLAGIDELYSLGRLSAAASQAFGTGAQAFQDLADLLAALTPKLTPSTQVLVKGSRSARMERVVEALVEQGATAC